MAADLIIKNGTLVDGTGAPSRQADIAVTSGKITGIGKQTGTAKRVIDAEGRIVAPGFIDPHTHYDAQICWDAAVTPSPWHGVTSVIMGNCGVGIAPCAPGARNTAMHDLVNVEGMPFEVLDRGITWDWESFPEFMSAAAARRSALNLGFIAPLTPFRYYVMGDAAIDRAATADEATRIAALVEEAVAAGAMGFSTTQLNNHIGHLGRPLACRNADRGELRAYANALKKLGKGIIEIALTRQVSVVSDDDYATLDFLLTESGRPVTFLSLMSRDDIPDACQASLRKLAPLLARGAYPQISPRPLTRDIDLKSPFSFMGFPSWHPVFNKPVEEQKKFYADPAFRNRFREEMKGPASFSGNWDLMAVTEATAPALKVHEGKTIAAIARERGVDGVDALLDLAIADELRTEFTLAFLNTNVTEIGKLLQDSRTLIGLSDGGAHLSVLCDAGYCTYLLGKWVRELKVLSMEQAVRRITSEPADFFGIRDRGRLVEGLAADIAIFDAGTIGSGDRGEKRFDLPGGAKRIVMPATGIDYTIVNGAVVYEGGSMTDALPGQVLRS
jgi:N-acyl-D-amino-acid deacylase